MSGRESDLQRQRIEHLSAKGIYHNTNKNEGIGVWIDNLQDFTDPISSLGR